LGALWPHFGTENITSTLKEQKNGAHFESPFVRQQCLLKASSVLWYSSIKPLL